MLLKREPDLAIIQAIKDKVQLFWKSIDDGVAPKPDFQKDADFISKLYHYAEPGKYVDVSGNAEFTALAKRHKELGSAMKACEIERDGLKAQMLMIIGDAEKGQAEGCTISAGLIGPVHVEYDREGYRAFKLNWPRAKKT